MHNVILYILRLRKPLLYCRDCVIYQVFRCVFVCPAWWSGNCELGRLSAVGSYRARLRRFADAAVSLFHTGFSKFGAVAKCWFGEITYRGFSQPVRPIGANSEPRASDSVHTRSTWTTSGAAGTGRIPASWVSIFNINTIIMIPRGCSCPLINKSNLTF